ncbi:MAG: hypothetical protein AB7P52_07655 [Alphaproteobacteria bacterium]
MITKLIVLIAVIAVVFFAFKYIARVKKLQRSAARQAAAPRPEPQGRFGWARRVFRAEDLVECPRCGTFVRSLDGHVCGKA